ncbi:hypothetical protein H4V95_002070 [Arthrobacter sp. CAN_C5]|nr:hypothetical protein [Arthrobacter sp. CAN_C5]
MVTHLLSGESMDMEDLNKLSEMDQTLVASNPPITHEFYAKCKADKREEFEKDYSFTTLNH